MATTAVIVLGIFTGVLMVIPLVLCVVWVNGVNRPRVLAVGLSLSPGVGKPILGCTVEARLVFDPKLLR